MITLFETQNHKNVMFNDFSTGSMVQCNQHVIVNGGEGMVLDPGGHKIYAQLFQWKNFTSAISRPARH